MRLFVLQNEPHKISVEVAAFGVETKTEND